MGGIPESEDGSKSATEFFGRQEMEDVVRVLRKMLGKRSVGFVYPRCTCIPGDVQINITLATYLHPLSNPCFEITVDV